jgi:hypothetical protein
LTVFFAVALLGYIRIPSQTQAAMNLTDTCVNQCGTPAKWSQSVAGSLHLPRMESATTKSKAACLSNGAAFLGSSIICTESLSHAGQPWRLFGK